MSPNNLADERKTEEFSEVGCRKCGKGGNWKIFTDGKGNFRAEHKCGYTSDFTIVKNPDLITIPMRLLV